MLRLTDFWFVALGNLAFLALGNEPMAARKLRKLLTQPGLATVGQNKTAPMQSGDDDESLHKLVEAPFLTAEPNPPDFGDQSSVNIPNVSSSPKESLHKLVEAPFLTAEPNPPDFGPNVLILEPGNLPEETRRNIADIYDVGHTYANDAQFSERRTAVFLKPGTHTLDIPLPFYFSVYGLGATPEDTIVLPEKNGLHVDLQGNKHSLQIFWRSIENLRHVKRWMNWWVSQASPLRSVIIDGTLQVASWAPASGGCIVNSKITGKLDMGSQEQWYMRSSSTHGYPAAASQGSFICVGCTNAGDGDKPFLVTYNWTKEGELWHKGLSYAEPPKVFAEKPFVAFEQGKYYLRIPPVKEDHSGPSWDPGQRVPFEQVFVVQEATTAAQINAKIAAGLHIVFPPGIYYMEQPIEITFDSCVMLGLGYATLIPTFGPEPLIRVGNVDDVRIAGFILQAGPMKLKTSALVQWGRDDSTYEGNPSRPGIMYDLTVRVGGPDAEGVSANYMVQINNGWVIGDNLWLWVADHCLTNNGICCTTPRHCDAALKVNGSNVHMYGLAAEHAEGDIVQWHGEKGRVFFFQSEFPYTPPVEDLQGDWVATPPDQWPRNCAFKSTAKDFRGVGMITYVTQVWACHGWRLRMQGGYTAFSVEHGDVWKHGMKDISAVNFVKTWPPESTLTCSVWEEQDGKCAVGETMARLYSARSGSLTAGWFGFSGLSLCLMLAAVASLLTLFARHFRRLSAACCCDRDDSVASWHSFGPDWRDEQFAE